MSEKSDAAELAEPFFDFDRKARDVLLPYRKTAPVRAIEWVSQAGDQTQMRVLAAGTIALGLIRRDIRMAGAGVRMLAAHELATFGKGVLKERVIRQRPRGGPAQSPKPHAGHDTRKEKSSFPSGHSAGAFATAGALAGAYPEHADKARLAAGAIALGRLPGCAHYPSDVAAGAVVGAASGGVVNALWRAVARAIAARRTAG